MFVAPVLADALVRGFALPLAAEIAAAIIIGGGYAAATVLLLSPRLRFDPTLGSRHSLVLLMAVAVGEHGGGGRELCRDARCIRRPARR